MAKLPKHIMSALRNNKTSLGEHPCYPPEEEEKFIVNLVSDIFEELSEKSDGYNIEDIKSSLGSLFNKCKNIEKGNKEALEKLCLEVINNIIQIPEQVLQIEAHLVDHVDTSNERMLPEKTSDFTFDNIDDMNYLTDEIYKRRMLNALVSGASIYYMNNIGSYVKELFEINPDLPALYKKCIDYNNLLLFYEKDTFDKDKQSDGGKVSVIISMNDAQPIIKSEGLIFPILVEETIKGILELSIAHGLPKKYEKAKYVMSKADFKLAELWDDRLGYCLWSLIEDEMSRCDYDMTEVGINFFLMELAMMDSKEFNSSLREIFARTRKGKEILSEIAEEILYKKEKDDFDNYIKSKNDSTVLITDDDCFTAEELLVDNEEDSFTPEELINDDIEYGLDEEVSMKQMRNAANRNATFKDSVQIRNNSHGELTTVKMNNKHYRKGALSRIVIKEFNNGRYERPKIINDTQDKLVRIQRNMLDRYTDAGFQVFKIKNDRVINKPCKYLFNRKFPIIMCIYIETDDLLSVTPSFDLEQVRGILDALKYKGDLPDTSFYRLPDKEMEKVRVRRPRINMTGNWDWIRDGKPRTYRIYDDNLHKI